MGGVARFILELQMTRQRIEPQSGVGFELRRGQTLRVIDPSGEQVADLMAFAMDDRAEWLSSGRSIDYNNTIYMTNGHKLYSNRSKAMLTIVADTVGRHDFLYTPCSRETFALIYDCREYHPSCLENLSQALAGFGIVPDSIGTTFNIFMNVDLELNGEVRVLPPRSRKNDFIEFRAEMDLIVGLTACSAELSNNHAFKPIDYEIRSLGL
jgi:uncharacterized protein YcgI (DUF1989 family)